MAYAHPENKEFPKPSLKCTFSSALDIVLATLFLVGGACSAYITIPFILRLSKFLDALRSSSPPVMSPEELANLLEGMSSGITALTVALVASSFSAAFLALELARAKRKWNSSRSDFLANLSQREHFTEN